MCATATLLHCTFTLLQSSLPGIFMSSFGHWALIQWPCQWYPNPSFSAVLISVVNQWAPLCHEWDWWMVWKIQLKIRIFSKAPSLWSLDHLSRHGMLASFLWSTDNTISLWRLCQGSWANMSGFEKFWCTMGLLGFKICLISPSASCVLSGDVQDQLWCSQMLWLVKCTLIFLCSVKAPHDDKPLQNCLAVHCKCYVWVLRPASFQSLSAGWAVSHRSPREGSQSLPSLLAGSQWVSHMHVDCGKCLLPLTWASEKRSPECWKTGV